MNKRNPGGGGVLRLGTPISEPGLSNRLLDPVREFWFELGTTEGQILRGGPTTPITRSTEFPARAVSRCKYGVETKVTTSLTTSDLMEAF